MMGILHISGRVSLSGGEDRVLKERSCKERGISVLRCMQMCAHVQEGWLRVKGLPVQEGSAVESVWTPQAWTAKAQFILLGGVHTVHNKYILQTINIHIQQRIQHGRFCSTSRKRPLHHAFAG